MCIAKESQSAGNVIGMLILIIYSGTASQRHVTDSLQQSCRQSLNSLISHQSVQSQSCLDLSTTLITEEEKA